MKNYSALVLILILLCGCNSDNKNKNSQENFILKLNRIIKCPKDNGIPIDIEFKNNDEVVLDWKNKSVFKNSINQTSYIIDKHKRLIHPGH